MTETLVPVVPSPTVAAAAYRATSTTEPKRKTRAACDACHLRRVKCEYRSPGLPVCIKCEKKGIRCTSSFIKPYKPRSGKRIEQARSVYGNLTPVVDSNGNEVPSKSRQIAFSAAITIADQLFYADNASSTIAHLIETQIQIMPYSLSNLIWPNVMIFVVEVNFRLEELEDELQVVIACLLATGARASNNSVILGEGCEPIDELWGHDLTKYGTLRTPMVNSLINRAVRLGDRAGLMRIATLKSIVALLMLEQLLNQSDPSCKRGYPYLSAACDHLRTLLQADDTSIETKNQILHHVAPFLFNRDALAAVAAERFPNLTTWDIRTYFSDSPFGLGAFLGTENVQNRDHWSIETRVIGLNIRTAALARALLESTSSPLAKKIGVLSPELLERLWTEIDVVKQEILNLQSGPITKLPDYYVPICASLAKLLFQCHRQLLERIRLRAHNLAEVENISPLWPSSVERVDQEILFICDLFQKVYEDPTPHKSPSLLSLRHLQNAIQQLPDGVERIKGVLLSDRSLRNKVLQALRSLAFAFPDTAEMLTRLESHPSSTLPPVTHQSPTMDVSTIFAVNPPGAVVVTAPPSFISSPFQQLQSLGGPMANDAFVPLNLSGQSRWFSTYIYDNRP